MLCYFCLNRLVVQHFCLKWRYWYQFLKFFWKIINGGDSQFICLLWEGRWTRVQRVQRHVGDRKVQGFCCGSHKKCQNVLLHRAMEVNRNKLYIYYELYILKYYDDEIKWNKVHLSDELSSFCHCLAELRETWPLCCLLCGVKRIHISRLATLKSLVKKLKVLIKRWIRHCDQGTFEGALLFSLRIS